MNKIKCDYCNMRDEKMFGDISETCSGKQLRTDIFGDAYIVSVFKDELFSIAFDTSGGEYGTSKIKINYCPICGRRLEPRTKGDNIK